MSMSREKANELADELIRTAGKQETPKELPQSAPSENRVIVLVTITAVAGTLMSLLEFSPVISGIMAFGVGLLTMRMWQPRE